MLAIALVASLAAQNATPTPRAERVLGYYDTTLKRVVIVGGAAQAGPTDRDPESRPPGSGRRSHPRRVP